MAVVTINNMQYDTDKFSDKAKADLQMLQITEREIAQLTSKLAIAQTARNAYAKSLEGALPAPEDSGVTTVQ